MTILRPDWCGRWRGGFATELVWDGVFEAVLGDGGVHAHG